MPNKRRRLRGTVVSDKMQKTIVIEVETIKRHRLYDKIIRSYKKYMAHDENNEAKIGDVVQIVESRPLSRHKRWALEAIVEKHVELGAVSIDEGEPQNDSK